MPLIKKKDSSLEKQLFSFINIISSLSEFQITQKG